MGERTRKRARDGIWPSHPMADARHHGGQALRKGLATALIGASVSACVSVPRLAVPAAPEATGYTGQALPQQTDSAPDALGGSQRFFVTDSVSAEWWHELGSPRLDALISEALAANPTLASAEASLRQADELFSAKAGSIRFPQVEASSGAQRQRFNPAALGQSGEAREFSLFTASVGVRYTLDLAGSDRHALEALAARTDYRWYQWQGARLTLAATVANAAVNRAMLAGQLEATESLLRVEEEQLAIGQGRRRLGAGSTDEVLTLQSQTDRTRAIVARHRGLLAQSEHLLASLAGRVPGSRAVAAITMSDLELPANLPLVVPSSLVRRRPDIQATEALMRAAHAEHGVAVARLYPRINLSAGLGAQALTGSALFGGGSAIWSLVSQLTQPLFNPGLTAEKRAALAAFDASAANYQGVVLESLRNVADVLTALESDARTLAALVSADAAARAALESVRQQYAVGAASHLQVLTALLQVERSQVELIAARAQRLLDSVALYQAMGGGADILPTQLSESGVAK